MPDREKVIRGLESCNAPNRHEGCPYDGAAHYNICTHHLLTDAIALLREQEPVEPGTSFDRPVCGVCGYHLILMDNYCPRCGRKVKWDDA